MKIIADEYINLFLKDMTDDKVVEAIAFLGLEQPLMDEQYEIDLDLSIIDEDNSGLSFVFEEVQGYSISGDLSLSKIEFHSKNLEILLPYNLNFNDSYDECVKKIEEKATFFSKRLKGNRSWLFKNEYGINYLFTIRFKDKINLQNINYILITPFNENDIGTRLLENKE